MNKRGVSPLVATLLLIAFAIAIGLVVMNWGKSYIEEKSEFVTGESDASSCNLVELSIIKVANKDKICYDKSDEIVEAFLESGPEVRIADMQVRIIGSEGIHTIDSILDSPLERATAAQIKFNYPSNIGDIQQIKIIPKIGTDTLAFCFDQSVISENIQQC